MLKSPVRYNRYWYAIHTYSRAEKKVFERLTRLGFETFLPTITTIKQWSDRKKKVTEPLIKSYVFVNTSTNKFIEILQVPGVLNVLKYLGKPAVVSQVEIENLKLLHETNDNVKIIDPISLVGGELVEVVKGPFKGMFGTYLNTAGKYRIIVKIEALQSFIEVNLPRNSIKKTANIS
jgi:transcription antitermination factor NusG